MFLTMPLKNISWIYDSENEAPESYENKDWYDSGTIYNTNDMVKFFITTDLDDTIDNSYIAWFRCLKDGLSAISPYNQPFYWEFVASDNRSNFMDKYIKTKTVSYKDKPMTIIVNAKLIDTIYLGNIKAKFIELEYDDETVVYDLKEDMSSISSVDMPSILYQRSCMLNVPVSEDKINYKITVTNGDYSTSDGYVALGEMLIGKSLNIATTLIPINSQLSNTSTVESEKNGDLYDNELLSYKDMDYQILAKKSDKDTIFRIFESIKQKKCLFSPYLATNDMSIVSYGKYENISIVTEDRDTVEISISVKGII